MGLRVQRFATGAAFIIIGFALWGVWRAATDVLSRVEAPLGMPGWMLLVLGLCSIVGGAAHAWRGMSDDE